MGDDRKDTGRDRMADAGSGASGLQSCRFRLFNTIPGLRHAVFTRHGGRSSAPYDSLNVGLKTGDDRQLVQDNRKRIALEMGMKPLVYLDQVHSDRVLVLKKDDNDLAGRFEPGKDIFTADGIITDMPGIFLVIQVADCQAVMMADPVRRVCANVHSGWRSAVKNIPGKCIDRMVREFNCDPADIRVGISPSLGPCCAEFINYTAEIPEEFWLYRIDAGNYFDFWRLSADQIQSAGVPENQIETMGICTRCNSDRFFSYRRQNRTGRFACVIGWEAHDSYRK